MREFDSTLPSISDSSLIPVLHQLSSQRPPPARLDALKVVDQDPCRSRSDQPQPRRKVQVGQARCPRADRSVARRPRGSSESPAVQGRERRVGSNKLERGRKEGRLRRRQGVLPELGAGHHRPTRRNEYHCRWFVLLLSTSHSILADLNSPCTAGPTHSNLGPKVRKAALDTRASKGRKLRYTPQDKIMNFMAPYQPEGAWHEEQVDELFGSLLGQRVQLEDEFMEVEEESPAMAAGLGGLRVF